MNLEDDWHCVHGNRTEACGYCNPGPTMLEEMVQDALRVAFRSGGVEGSAHKAWVIDQMVRALTGKGYAEWVRLRRNGEDGPETYDWDEGTPP